jgi:hypothetical protein
LAFLGAALLFLLTSESQVGLFDEGIMLTGAFRVLAGEQPSRDFLVNYGPGQFWALAMAFKLFGANVLVARAWDAAVCAAIVVVTHLMLARSRPRWLAACAALCVGALLVEFRLACSPIQPAILISLVGAFLLSETLATGGRRAALLPVSLALGLLLVFRYDIAPLSTVAFASAMLVVEVGRRRGVGQGSRPSLRRFSQDLVVLGSGPLLVIAILAAAGILGPALSDLQAYYTFTKYVAIRALPWPGVADFAVMPLDTVAVYTPILAAALGLVTVGRAKREGRALHAEPRLIAVAVFTIVTAAFFTKGLVRTSGPHMLFANVPATVLTFLCLSLGFAPDEPRRRSVVGATTFFVAWILVRNAYSAAPLYRELKGLQTHPELPALSCFRLEDERLRAAATIVELTEPSERIHSATGRHDKVYAVDMQIYFVTQRLPASRWHHYDPGVQTTPLVQREIMRDLEEQQVRVVMVDVAYDQVMEPNQSAVSSGVIELDRYLRATFEPAAYCGTSVVAVRKPR